MMQRADLLERVREGIVPDVVQQCGVSDDEARLPVQPTRQVTLFEQRKRSSREMVCAEGVLEARVARAGIHEIREAELSNVAQPLERARVDEAQRERIDADVVPERIADDLVCHAQRSRVAAFEERM